MTVYAPSTVETDPKKQNRSLQANAAATTANTTAIAALTSATYVNSIAGNSGAFTLNAASGITNATNDIKLSPASASQFGAVKVDNSTIIAVAGVISTNTTPIKASLVADVLLNNTANYFDGPSIAQGSAGTWWVSGTVTIGDTGGAAAIQCKLWDGTTVIASGRVFTTTATATATIALSGFIVSPAANLKISCKDTSAATGKIFFNNSGESKDSTISAYRIA